MSPPTLPFLRHALVIGAAAGVIEVALRVSPRWGLGVGEVATLTLCSAGLSALVSLLVALPLTRIGFRPWGLHLGVLLGLQAATNYRFEVVLNEFLKDPRVWGGVSGLFLLGMVVGLPFDGLLQRLHARVGAALGAAALLAAGVAVVRATPVEGPAPTQPRIVIVSLDTQRMDRLSPYGHSIATPHIQKLADEGAVFTQAIAEAPITEPSHLAMLTGIAPYRSGVVSNGTQLGDRPALIWRALDDKGWLTAAFVAGFPLHSKYGWDQGADVFDDDFGALPGVQALTITKAWNQVAVKEHALRERTADRVLSHALPWLERHKDEQFFAFIHFYDVHGPYTAPSTASLGAAPTDGPAMELPPYWPADQRRITSPEYLERAYDEEVKYVDDAVGRIVATLGPVLDDTILVITADHGESFTEHAPYFDHGDNLYDPSLRVPLIIRYPKAVKAGTRVDCQVGGVDVTVTLLDMLGIDDGQTRDGVSRKAQLAGEPCTADSPVVSSTTAGRFVAVPPVAHSFRLPAKKVVVHDDKPVELYDLVADPKELRNLAPSPAAEEEEKAFRTLLSGGGPQVGVTMDPETCRQLAALGYVDGASCPQ